MFRVYYCLTNDHDWRLVALAGLVCLLGSLVAINLFQRARSASGRTRLAWLLTAGAATGCGVWATHFISMLNFTPGPTISFGIEITALSLLVAIVVISAGLAVALYIQDRWSLIVGGAIVGAGVVCMHYTGMMALEVAADLFWAPDLVMASIFFSVVFGAAAMHVAGRGDSFRLGVLAALLLTGGVVSLHFTAMGAVGFMPDGLRTVNAHALSPTAMAFAIAAVVGSMLGMCLIGALSDRRAQRDVNAQIKRLDAAVNNMCQGLCMFDSQGNLQVWNERYLEMYRIDLKDIWIGCTMRDLLAARTKAGTFPLDAERYAKELEAHLAEGKTFTIEVELEDGRVIAVVNQPIESGGWVATHEDITERVRAGHELSRTRSFLDTIISNVPMPIVVKSVPDLKYTLVNKAAEKFFGLPASEIIGRTAHDIMPRQEADAVRSHDLEMISNGRESFFDEHSVVTRLGERRIVTSTRLPIMGPDGMPQYLIGVVHDVTQRKRDEARISYMAHHDPLTDLPNRDAFNKCLSATCELAAGEGAQFAVLSLDLDRFQGVNDVFGHSAGDGLLRQVSGRLEEACHGAFLARVGGDEFVVISPSGPQPATAETLAERLSKAMEDEFEVDGKLATIGITIGVGVYPQDGAEPDALVANTDAALHRAKSQARGSIRFFEPAMDKRLRDRRALQHDLRSALANDELELYYQPLVKIEGDVVGFEALVRWHHPERGMVPPSTFIPLAEEGGMIVALGEWVLRAACEEAATWPRHLRVAVNLSPVQFQHGDLCNLVHTVLLETGMQPDRLELEITEGVLIADFSRAVSTLRRLKTLGVRIAMDDFGTGYSSLSYLQAFPFDKIKIDQSFIVNVGRNAQSGAIVRAVIGLAHGLGLPVVAEGVETEEQRAFLRTAGCDEIQGYLIGQPAPAATYAELLGRQAPKIERPRRQVPAA